MTKTMVTPKKATKKATTKASKIVVAPQQTVSAPKVKKVKVVPTLENTVGKGWKKNPYLYLPVVLKTRTQLAQLIASTNGKTFTATHIGKDGQPHTSVGIRHKIQNSELGYIKIYDLKDAGERLINPQTLTAVKFCGVLYKAKK